MTNCFDAACPRCGGTDELDVVITTWARLMLDGTSVEDSMDSAHEFTGESLCRCAACDWIGQFAETTNQPQET